jgi:hypothetical protein
VSIKSDFGTSYHSVVAGMNLLYPKFPIKQLPAMMRTAFLGAMVAGCYGALHDQISYSISPEYFTKFKLRQFSYVDFGWPPRAFAAEVGFLASWWVGMAAGWFVARAGLAELPPPVRRRYTMRSFAILLTACPLGGVVGALVGVALTQSLDAADLRLLQYSLGLEDVRAFVVVGYLHAGTYLGALTGLIAAIIYIRKQVRRVRLVFSEPL